MTVGAELARREVPLSGVSAAARDLRPKGTVVHGHRHVNTSRPGAGQRRRGQRPDVTFPTAVLDFRPVAAGFDSGLGWLSRFTGLRILGHAVARWTGRLVIHVNQIDNHTLIPQPDDKCEMLRLLVTNGRTDDTQGVRFQTQWTADSALFNVKTEEGLWVNLRSQEQAHGAAKEVDFDGRGIGLHVGLATKYLDDTHAYIVTPEGHSRVTQGLTTWRWPAQALAPGRYFVDVSFRSRDGRGAIIRLTVDNPGRGGRLMTNLSVGQLVA